MSDTQVHLIEGSFDLALRNSALEDSSLKARRLADDNRVLCASPHYLVKHGQPEHPQDLNNHRLIGFKDLAPKELVGQDGTLARFAPRDAISWLVVDDGLSQKIATVAGAGISSNSLWSVHKELAEGALIRVLPHYEINDQAALWLVYPISNALTAKVRIFIDFLLSEIGTAPAWVASK